MTSSPPSNISVCCGMKLYVDSTSSFINNEVVIGLLYIVFTA